MQIKNTVAVVTGGGSGLGEASARRLANNGAKLVLLDRNLEAAEKVAKDIGGLAIACDVSSADDIANAFEQIKAEAGVARICLNCAGIAPAKRMVGRKGVMPLEDFATVINVNLVGTFNVMRIAAAEMIQLDIDAESGERGVIINTASVAAFEGQIGQTAYSASKGGVAAMTLPAARELASQAIRVMTIAPGIFATPMMTAMPQEVQDNLAADIPFPKRLGQPDEYAQLAQQIIENSMLNGTVVRLDGAIRMQPK